MNKLIYKGVEFSRLEDLKHINKGEIMTPIKWGQNITKLLYTSLDGSAYYIDCRTYSISFEGVRVSILATKQGITFQLLEDAILFLSSCGNMSFLNKMI